MIRPLRLEGHGELWYLHAYCTLAQPERLFRLDRIAELTLVADRTSQAGSDGAAARVRRPSPNTHVPGRRKRHLVPSPRSGFFPAPPPPPSNSPLLRVWLDE